NIEEAMQELCPFPGYYGIYCPQETTATYKRQLQQGIPKMPSGVGASFNISTGELKLPAIFLHIHKIQTNIFQADSDADIRIFKNEFELTNIWLDVTKNGQWLGGEYISSKDLIDVFNRFFRGNQYTSIAQLPKNVVRMVFKTDNLKLNRFAYRAIDSLPENYQEDIYNKFLNTWDTHISVDTLIGGMIEKQTILKGCVFFTPQFSGVEGFSTARRQVNLDHKFGGNPEDGANWEQTISKKPALLKINIFLSWENLSANPQVRANLSQAIARRIDSMRQRQESYEAQVREQRRLERVGPRTAWAIQGNSQCYTNFSPSFYVRRQFELKVAEVCINTTDENWLNCTSGPQHMMISCMKLDIYQRYLEGNYRAIIHNPVAEYPGGLREADGNFVDRGFSIAQHYRDVVYSDFKQTLPNETYIKMICTDCHPDVYNIPSGVIFQCSCPTF
ncbi:hypothetical protein ABPG72_019050, partial [Tetrahymena utriculariae]